MVLRVGIAEWTDIGRRYTSLPFRDVEIVRRHDLFTVVNAVRRRMPGLQVIPATAFSYTAHWDAGLPGVDLMHLFNSTSWSNTPWVVTFEHYLPRWDMHSSAGLRRLAGRHCRRLIAASQWAFDNQCRYLGDHRDVREEIVGKMGVLHPAQALTVGAYDEKHLDGDRITCTFVGREFFRKGGWEALRAFGDLIDRGFPVKLIIVSTMDYGDYITRTTAHDQRKAMELIGKYAPRITLIPSLPNPDVLALLRDSHIGLLPTYVDTYGFSVLESQASACPVISTNGCALPEINDDRIGWLIDLPKDEYGVVRTGGKGFNQKVSARITDGIISIMEAICASPEQVRDKGERAHRRIAADFSPARKAEELTALYSAALAGTESRQGVRSPAGEASGGPAKSH